jgi:peptide/nickel transport system substrate-binding protein/oligopeptide transport system substrate-binding protein
MTIGRRQFLKTSALAAGGLALAACVPAGPAAPAPAESAPSAPLVNSLGVELPADAAPLDQQVFRFTGIEGKHFDVARNEYEGFAYEYAAEFLARRDGDNVYHPAAADSWEVAEDGLTWTFHLRQDALWSDGTPVTAEDWVFSLIRYEDPAMANPYAWFFYNILNAEAFNKGEVAVEEFGVKQVDDHTFTIMTKEPIPYFLDIANWHYLVPKHMVDEHGDAWADSPETAVSNGPFVIQEWNKGKNVVYGLNPHYNGPWKPQIERMEMVIVPESGAPLLQMYQAGEIDTVPLGGDELAQVMADSAMQPEVFAQTAFTTAYIFFNDTKPPFDDLKVRQAFSHAIDRDALVTVMRGLVEPAYGHLPTGFPCSQNENEEFRQIQAYDPELAKQLMTEAGFANGEGFPTFELWTRQGQYVREAEAIQNMLKENLGITVTVVDQERSFYMDKLAAHEIDLGLIQWGADYVDPTNFFDWWGNQSRHTWINEEFNGLIDQARGLLDTEERCRLYNEAEKILVSDVGGVFVVFPVVGTLYKPYVGNLPLNSQNVPGLMTQIVNPSIYIKAH